MSYKLLKINKYNTLIYATNTVFFSNQTHHSGYFLLLITKVKYIIIMEFQTFL